MEGRRTLQLILSTALLAGTITLTSACATAAPRGRVYLRVGPPAPVYEVRVASPGAGYVWIPGYYRSEARGYVWVPGRWDRPPRARARWVPARWVHDRRGWYVVEGHWR